MPQLEPIYYINTIKVTILGMVTLMIIYGKYIIGRRIERERIGLNLIRKK